MSGTFSEDRSAAAWHVSLELWERQSGPDQPEYCENPE
jgi:hypothetical protein